MFLDRLAARMSGGFLLAEGEGGDGGGGAAPKTALATPPADGSAAGTGEGGAADANPWPENWRETMAGDDQKALARLQRMSSPGDLFKSYREIETKLSSRPAVPVLPDDATPEEIAAYRKTAGIPENADGYALAFPETMQPSDADKATLTAFQEHMLAANVTPAAAKAAFEFYTKQMGEQATARAAAAEDATLKSLADLRGEFKGREYERHMRIADDFLMKHFGDEPETLQALNEVLTMRLPNGVPVMYFAPFMKGLFKMAAASADEEALIGGDILGAGKSMDEEYNELIQKSVTKPREMTQADHARLEQIATARVSREQRAGRAPI